MKNKDVNMSLPTKAKVVIIGGGIHGLSTAWKLSETYKNPGDIVVLEKKDTCLLYTSPSPRDQRGSRMPSSA